MVNISDLEPEDREFESHLADQIFIYNPVGFTHHEPMSEAPSKQIDLLELIKSGSHYTERRGDRIHVVEAKTGATISMYSDNNQGVPETLELVVLEDGTKVWTQPALVAITKRTNDVLFSPILIDLICQAIVQGKNVTDICDVPPYPSYVTFCRWRREHPWIDEALDRARADRAELYRDQVLKEAKEAVSTKDPINASNLKIETLKWAAGVDSPAKYSPKAKMEATVNMPTQIIVNTGIDRTQKVKDVTPKLESSDDKGS